MGDRNVFNFNAPSEAKIDEIRDLLRQRGYPDDPNRLLQKYSLGYVIFDLTYKSQVTPYETLSVVKNHEVDWSVVKIVQNTKDRIALRLPSFKRKDGTIEATNNETGGRKKIGYLGCRYLSTPTEGLAVCGEILAIRGDEVVSLMNFMQWPPL